MSETTQVGPVLGEDARRWLESAIGPYLVGGTVGQWVMARPLVDEIVRHLNPSIDEAVAAAEQRGAERERERIIGVLNEHAELAKQGAETAARNPDFPMPDRYVVTRALRDAATKVSR